MDLSILIPARNEMYLPNTVEDILKNRRAKSEIIIVLDGQWPVEPLPDHPAVSLIYHSESIGQRAATNEAARLSRAKFIMKLDAHCSVDEGFDLKLMQDCEPDWTVIPRMYNLHVFDWECKKCGHRWYMGPTPTSCDKCDNTVDFVRRLVWEKRKNRYSDHWRFDSDLKFQYWRGYGKRPELKGKYIADTMSSIGACFFMHRERFWEIEGLDEGHGSWGQVGTEVACKSWLSGGRQVVNKKTWFAHMFRTRKDFSFPYPLSGKQVSRARKHSKKLWLGNSWPRAKHDLDWLINKFAPVPGWENLPPARVRRSPSKEIVYYTDNRPEERILRICREQLARCVRGKGIPVVTVSQVPIDFGHNIVMPLPRCVLSLYRQVLAGLKAAKADIIFLIEHDLIYHPCHFDIEPPDGKTFFYNRNRWALCSETGKAVFYQTNVPSLMCAHRDLLIEHYSRAVKLTEGNGSPKTSKYGFAPPRGLPKDQQVGRYKTWMSEHPCIDIRHNNTFTRRRMDKSQFRSERSCRGWTEADEIPFWGKTLGRFDEFLYDQIK